MKPTRGASVRAGDTARGPRPRAGSPDDPLRGDRFAALLFYALPAALAVWGLGAVVAFTYGLDGMSEPAWKLQVTILPLVALFGVVGAWLLKRNWVLGSSASLGIGAMLAIPSPPLALFYALSSAMMFLTARKVS